MISTMGAPRPGSWTRAAKGRVGGEGGRRGGRCAEAAARALGCKRGMRRGMYRLALATHCAAAPPRRTHPTRRP